MKVEYVRFPDTRGINFLTQKINAETLDFRKECKARRDDGRSDS